MVVYDTTTSKQHVGKSQACAHTRTWDYGSRELIRQKRSSGLSHRFQTSSYLVLVLRIRATGAHFSSFSKLVGPSITFRGVLADLRSLPARANISALTLYGCPPARK